ncbi:undecaprenyldiphospho-muramoylpentapeptide beta-N-acetylglucosaminyltransferase, partial [Thioflexithrix psekupsensis]
FGGFVTGPGGIAAWLAGIPLFIHEQNALAGLTNRWLARVATRVMSAFPETFAEKYNPVVTGNPLRAEFATLPEVTRPRSPFRILVVGGSLGALVLNETVPAALLQLHEKTGLSFEVWHQTGAAHIETMQMAYANAPFSAKVSAFIEDMAQAYVWADLAICRAGALTISELAQAGLPALLIPFPHAVDDHQTHNARYLSQHEAAISMSQTQLSVELLAQLLEALLQNPLLLQKMSTTARSRAKPDALAQVVGIVESFLVASGNDLK